MRQNYLPAFILLYFYRIELSIPKQLDGTFSRCEVYNVDFSTILKSNSLSSNTKYLNYIKPNNSWPIKNCDTGFKYNFSDIPYATIATEVRKYTFEFALKKKNSETKF